MWIEELPNGKYKFFERYKDPYTEKWKRVSVTLDSGSNRAKKEAQKLLDGKIGKKEINALQSDITFCELYTQWFERYKKKNKRSSWIKVPPMMSHIYKIISSDILVRNIDEALVRQIVDEMYTFGDYSLNYTKQTRTVLSMILNHAVQLKIISNNPVASVRLEPKKAEEEKKMRLIEDKYLEKEEIDLLIKNLYSKPRKIMHARICEFLSLTGLRYGELQALLKKDYSDGAIRVNGTLDYTSVKLEDAEITTPKNFYSNRIVSLPERAIEILDEVIMENQVLIPDYGEDDYIFIFNKKKKTPLGIQSINATLHEAEVELDIQKKLTSHIFRHSHVSLLSERNIPLKAIMERVGHGDAKTTISIYNHVTKKSKDDVLSALNNL